MKVQGESQEKYRLNEVLNAIQQLDRSMEHKKNKKNLLKNFTF